MLIHPVLDRHVRVNYVRFEYLQPRDPAVRGVDWSEGDATTTVRLGHGTYWECAAGIVATGAFSPSTTDDTYGEREWHGAAEGVYLTDIFATYAGHYAWPCNVFGNKCFYGISFQVLANQNHLVQVGLVLYSLGVRIHCWEVSRSHFVSYPGRSDLSLFCSSVPGETYVYRSLWVHRRGFEGQQEFRRPGYSANHELVYNPKGIIITHVVVTFNREVCQGYCRGRWFQADCEFLPCPIPAPRKYPTLRPSVWSDGTTCHENYEKPADIPTSDTDQYLEGEENTGPVFARPASEGAEDLEKAAAMLPESSSEESEAHEEEEEASTDEEVLLTTPGKESSSCAGAAVAAGQGADGDQEEKVEGSGYLSEEGEECFMGPLESWDAIAALERTYLNAERDAPGSKETKARFRSLNSQAPSPPDQRNSIPATGPLPSPTPPAPS